jgi:hypothetical protein
MPALKKVTPRTKINTRAKITGPGGRRLNLGDIMRAELHRLVGEHKLSVKKGASKNRGSAKLAARLMQEIDRVTYCLQAMSVDLDE